MTDLRRRLTKLEIAQDRRRAADRGGVSMWAEQGPGEPLEAFLGRLAGTRARLVRLAAHEPASSADRVAEVVAGVRFVSFESPADVADWEARSIAVHAGQATGKPVD